MKEWRYITRIEPPQQTTGGEYLHHVELIGPDGEMPQKLIPADLARGLYEAANLAIGNAKEDDPEVWEKIDALLARYEREVGQ